MARFLKNLNAVSRSTNFFREQRLKSYGITGHQVKYLFALSRAEGVSQDELAKSLYVNKSNVARQLASLEAGGFVRREVSGEDRRVLKIYLTERGRELMPVIRAVNDEWYAVLLGGISEEESVQLSRLLDRLIANAAKYMEAQE